MKYRPPDLSLIRRLARLCIARFMARTTIIAALLLPACGALAVQPFPGGCTVIWDAAPQSSGWSNVSFIVWHFPPGSATGTILTNTTATSYRYTGNVLFQTQFGVSAVGQSNRVFYQTDIGIALYQPAPTNGPGFVNLTPRNPWTVPTGQWLNASTDLKTWTQRQRFGIAGSNVLVEIRETTNAGAGFIAAPVVQQAPLPAGGAP
jgi:hypothetical protein